VNWSKKHPSSPLISEAHPTPLPTMASGGDHSEHPWGRVSNHDVRQQPSHRVRMDATPGLASSSTRWGFTLCQRLPGLASYHDADSRFSISVGLLLHQAQRRRRRWPLSYRSSSLTERGSSVEKAPSLHGRLDWWLLSAPLRGCSWNVTLSTSRPRLPSRTSTPGCEPLVPGLTVHQS
jgi:hypothetical protein